MEKKQKLNNVYRATENRTEVQAILIGMPRTPLAEIAHQLAVLGGQSSFSEAEQFKLQYLELPRYEYGAKPLPANVTGPGVDLSKVLPMEILVKVIELLSPPNCLILAAVNKFFYQILKEDSFWKTYCERLLNSQGASKEYKKVLDRNKLSYKRLALHVFGNPDPFVFYSRWEAHQQLERSKTDKMVSKEVKELIKKKRFPLNIRFETFFAHDFEIRLPHYKFMDYIIMINLEEYDWQIERADGLKDYLWLCAESIKKFCEKLIEEKKKTVPVKKHQWIRTNYMLVIAGYMAVVRKFENQPELQQGRFTSIEAISAYINTLLHDYLPRIKHIMEPSEAALMTNVYEALLENVYIESSLSYKLYE